LKSQVGAVETIVVGTAEILEDVVRLKWGEIAKRLYSFKHRRIELLEGEMTAPGSEVAYIVKARNQFS